MTQPVPRMFAAARNRPPAQKRRMVWGLLIICFFMLGPTFLTVFADRFVFYFAEEYTTISLWAVVLFTPFVTYWMRRTREFAASLAEKLPTSWIRNWVMMPLSAAILVGAIFAAPLGWLFVASAWYGGTEHEVRATAVNVGAYAGRKGCDQKATLRIASVDKETCLDSLYPPSTMREGQPLKVTIVMFPFGFLIVSITNADSA